MTRRSDKPMTPPPTTEGHDTQLHSNLEQMQADGLITPDDADEIRTFAAFLDEVGPDRRNVRAAYAKHYPEDYARAVAEQEARS